MIAAIRQTWKRKRDWARDGEIDGRSRTAAPGVDGVRRGDRRRRPGGARRRDPVEADFVRHFRRRGRKGLRGRRPHHVRRSDRSGRARCAAAAMARRGHPDQDRGDRRSLLHAGPRRCGADPQHPAAAADEQSRQFHRLAGQCVPLARRPRRSRPGSRSIRDLPRPRCSTARTARSSASPPATWGGARTASPRTPSPAAWSCAPNTPCSAKARAAS